MNMLLALWQFQRKLILPTLSLSLLMGFFARYMVLAFETQSTLDEGLFSVPAVVRSYILFGLLMHALTYELRSPGEYFFYHNLGLGKRALWVSTLVFCVVASVVLGVIISLIISLLS